jgi:hypothetical protein
VQLHEGLAPSSRETPWRSGPRRVLHLRDMPKVPGRKKQTRARAPKAKAHPQAKTIVHRGKTVAEIARGNVGDMWSTPASAKPWVLEGLDMSAPPPSKLAIAAAKARNVALKQALKQPSSRSRYPQGPKYHKVECPTCGGSGHLFRVAGNKSR